MNFLKRFNKLENLKDKHNKFASKITDLCNEPVTSSDMDIIIHYRNYVRSSEFPPDSMYNKLTPDGLNELKRMATFCMGHSLHMIEYASESVPFPISNKTYSTLKKSYLKDAEKWGDVLDIIYNNS